MDFFPAARYLQRDEAFGSEVCPFFCFPIFRFVSFLFPPASPLLPLTLCCHIAKSLCADGGVKDTQLMSAIFQFRINKVDSKLV